jgi:uncharacterized protein
MKQKQEKRILQKLYSRIPQFKCLPECGACCGPVPASRQELAQAPELVSRETLGEIAQILAEGPASPLEMKAAPQLSIDSFSCGSCPYLGPSKECTIYERRPLLCRIFGTAPSLPCPKGVRCEHPLTLAQERSIMREYWKLFGSSY